AALKLNPPFGAGKSIHSFGVNDSKPFQISPDSGRVVYRANQDTSGVVELYSVALTGGATTKLNPPIVSGGGVTAFDLQITPDSTRVVFGTDQDIALVRELYSVPIAGGACTKLNPPFSPSHLLNLQDFQISAD